MVHIPSWCCWAHTLLRERRLVFGLSLLIRMHSRETKGGDAGRGEEDGVRVATGRHDADAGLMGRYYNMNMNALLVESTSLSCTRVCPGR
jgi:hypothetical protein